MTLEKLLELCRIYRDLGDAVADQLDEVLEDSDRINDQNPNALRMIDQKFLKEIVACGDEECEDEARSLRVQLKEAGVC